MALGVAGDGGGEDVAILGVVGHRGFEARDRVLGYGCGVERHPHRVPQALGLVVGGPPVGDTRIRAGPAGSGPGGRSAAAAL